MMPATAQTKENAANMREPSVGATTSGSRSLRSGISWANEINCRIPKDSDIGKSAKDRFIGTASKRAQAADDERERSDGIKRRSHGE